MLSEYITLDAFRRLVNGRGGFHVKRSSYHADIDHGVENMMCAIRSFGTRFSGVWRDKDKEAEWLELFNLAFTTRCSSGQRNTILYEILKSWECQNAYASELTESMPVRKSLRMKQILAALLEAGANPLAIVTSERDIISFRRGSCLQWAVEKNWPRSVLTMLVDKVVAGADPSAAYHHFKYFLSPDFWEYAGQETIDSLFDCLRDRIAPSKEDVLELLKAAVPSKTRATADMVRFCFEKGVDLRGLNVIRAVELATGPIVEVLLEQDSVVHALAQQAGKMGGEFCPAKWHGDSTVITPQQLAAMRRVIASYPAVRTDLLQGFLVRCLTILQPVYSVSPRKGLMWYERDRSFADHPDFSKPREHAIAIDKYLRNALIQLIEHGILLPTDDIWQQLQAIRWERLVAGRLYGVKTDQLFAAFITGEGEDFTSEHQKPYVGEMITALINAFRCAVLLLFYQSLHVVPAGSLPVGGGVVAEGEGEVGPVAKRLFLEQVRTRSSEWAECFMQANSQLPRFVGDIAEQLVLLPDLAEALTHVPPVAPRPVPFLHAIFPGLASAEAEADAPVDPRVDLRAVFEAHRPHHERAGLAGSLQAAPVPGE